MDNQSTVHEVGNQTNCPTTVPDGTLYFQSKFKNEPAKKILQQDLK